MKFQPTLNEKKKATFEVKTYNNYEDGKIFSNTNRTEDSASVPYNFSCFEQQF